MQNNLKDLILQLRIKSTKTSTINIIKVTVPVLDTLRTYFAYFSEHIILNLSFRDCETNEFSKS